jgi:hypothetical protein
MTTCSICLNEVRSSRHNSNPPIRCGHIFHRHCLEKWKAKGKHTCPLCRQVFDVSKFTVSLTVTNNYTSNVSTTNLNTENVFNVFDIFELNVDLEDTLDLDRLFSDIGLTLDDVDSNVFTFDADIPLLGGGSGSDSNTLPSDAESVTE